MTAPSSLVFPRDRLFLRLDAVRRAPIALVVASAETGKSTAVRAYLAARGVAHVRVGHQPEFLRGLVDAFGSVAPAMRSSASGALGRFAGGDDDGTVLSWLCEHLAGVATTVVVDELELIAAEPRSVALLRSLIDATVPRLRWILVGREAAAFPVARWLAGSLTDLPVDDDDLRIDLAEARAAAASAGLALDELVLAKLYRAAAGSPLRLAVALASGRADEGESHGALYDRLAATALGAQDERTHQRWCEAALVGRFDATLLRAIDPGTDAEATLAALTAAGFVYADEDGTHAFHEPFRERLLAHLQALPRARREASYARAAAALEANGRWPEAVALRMRAPDGERIASALDARGFRAIDSGEIATVREALEAVPDEILNRHPIALAMRALVASLDESYDLSEAWFRMAIDAASETVRRSIVVRYGLDLVRRGRTDVIELLEAEAAREGAEGDDFAAELYGLLGTAYVGARRLDDAREAARRALSRLHDVCDVGVRARILHQSAYVALNDGDYVAAKDLAELAYETAESAYLYDLAARALSVLHNVAVFYEDDLPGGRRALAKLDGAARKAGSTTLRLYAVLNAYGLEVDAGDNEEIARLDGELRELRIFLTPMASEALLPAQALRAAWDGRFEHAYGLLAPSAEKLFDDDRTAYRWAEVAVYAAAAGKRSESAAAIRRCRDTLRKADPADRLMFRARAYLALAEILLAHDGRARSALAELRVLARRGGPRFAALVEAVRGLYLRWTTGWHGAPPLAEALENLERLDLGGVARFFGALPLPSSDRARLGLLSETEKRILSAVASGGTSKEIAVDLDRSPQTVDVHIRTICRKLGCSGRRQAVALALREGLIGERRRQERSAG